MLPIAPEIARRIEVVKGDITQLAVDAIVTPTDPELTHGGTVDKAVHAAAGPGLRKACDLYVEEQGRCFAGGAFISEAYNLPCRYVIHAVGPAWCGGEEGEGALLARAYARCFELMRLKGLETVAFSSISTDNYLMPYEVGALVALQVTIQVLEFGTNIQKVIFCVLDDENKETYERLIKEGVERYAAENA